MKNDLTYIYIDIVVVDIISFHTYDSTFEQTRHSAIVKAQFDDSSQMFPICQK